MVRRMRRFVLVPVAGLAMMVSLGGPAPAAEDAAACEQAALHVTAGDVDAALASYGRCLASDALGGEERATHLTQRAKLLETRGQQGPALVDYNDAIALAPTAERHYARGLLHHRMHNLDLAARDFSAAIVLDPMLADAHTGLGLVWFDWGDVDLALRNIDAALAIDAESALAYRARGMTLMLDQRPAEAVTDLGEAIAREPKVVISYMIRAYAWLALGDLRASVDDFGAVVALAPDNACARLGRAKLMMALGDDPMEVLADLDHITPHSEEMVAAMADLREEALIALGRADEVEAARLAGEAAIGPGTCV